MTKQNWKRKWAQPSSRSTARCSCSNFWLHLLTLPLLNFQWSAGSFTHPKRHCWHQSVPNSLKNHFVFHKNTYLNYFYDLLQDIIAEDSHFSDASSIWLPVTQGTFVKTCCLRHLRENQASPFARTVCMIPFLALLGHSRACDILSVLSASVPHFPT